MQIIDNVSSHRLFLWPLKFMLLKSCLRILRIVMVTQWPLIGGLRAIYCKPHARIHSRILATFLCSYPRSPHFMLNLVVSLGQVQYYREVPNSSGGQNNSTKTCCEGYQTHSESHSFWRDIRCFWSERVILAFHMSVRLKRPDFLKFW